MRIRYKLDGLKRSWMHSFLQIDVVSFGGVLGDIRPVDQAFPRGCVSEQDRQIVQQVQRLLRWYIQWR